MNVTSKRHHLHCCLIALHISESTTSNCSLDGKPPGASNRKYSISTWQESAALRDFGPAYDRLGSKPELPSNGLMSALASCGHSGGNAYRRFVPLGDLSRCNNVLRLLDHLVDPHQHRQWNVEAERLCGLEVDD